MTDDEVWEKLGKVGFVLWFCPNPECKRVEWTTNKDKTMTPRCLDCGNVGEPRRASGSAPAPTEGEAPE